MFQKNKLNIRETIECPGSRLREPILCKFSVRPFKNPLKRIRAQSTDG
jgi:hypothetical protein